MPIAPTLILGLGGTGSKIVERVAEKVKESNSAQSDRIAFVAFDTDVNDLGRIRQQSPAIYTVQTSTRNTVGEYLNVNTNARDNWFPVNEMLNRKTLTEGAAQVRAISRLAFDTTLKAGNLEPLHQAIEELFRIDKDQEEQTLRVIITVFARRWHRFRLDPVGGHVPRELPAHEVSEGQGDHPRVLHPARRVLRRSSPEPRNSRT